MNAALDRERTQRFGKYILIERLGRGGMAEVWKARMSGPAGFQRTMVVKRILPHLVEDPQFVNMFVGEARLSARLNHANIVQVFELGDVSGEYYLAMEYVRGRDLVNVVRAQLQKSVLPPPGLGAFVVREVCRALAYAHALTDERGQPLRLIHRDVSPSNVMIAFDGAVKLLDFGIAKALAETAENKTVTGTLKGKFGYMAPEQVDGKEFDHRADLFAAGIVLHEVLTGKRLFKGQTDLHTIAMVREAKVDAPSRSNPAVPPELDAICLKALAREPDDRWPGCGEMAMALDDVVHQLKWGPERLALSMRELFPEESVPTQNVPALPDTAAHSVPSELEVPRRRTWIWALAGLALLGGGGATAWLATHRSAPPAGQTSPAPKREQQPVPDPVPHVEAQSPTIKVNVATLPPGADVYLGDEAAARGQTPLTLPLPRGSTAQRLTLRLKGYETQTSDVMPDADSRLVLTLSKAATPAHGGAKHGVGSKHGTPPATTPLQPSQQVIPISTPQKKAPDLQRGDVVDPFDNSNK